MSALVVVYRAAGLSEAEIIRGFLESEDLPVHLQYESAGPAFGLTVNGLGEVRVCVPEAFAEEAHDLLRPLNRGRGGRPSSLERVLEFVRRVRGDAAAAHGGEDGAQRADNGPSSTRAEPGGSSGTTGDDREADPAA